LKCKIGGRLGKIEVIGMGEKEFEISINRALIDRLFRRRFFNVTEENFRDLDNILLEEEKRKISEYPKFLNRYFQKVVIRRKLYDNLMSKYLKPGDIVLDGGCGKKSGLRHWYQPGIKLLLGIDLSHESLLQNRDLDYGIVGNLEALPFPDNFFDAIRTNGVVEHLAHPNLVFREFHRVLKKNGWLFIKTNCVYNPYMSINALLPMRLRHFIVKKVLNIEGEQFPAYYRCNSPKCLNKTLKNIGFRKEYIFTYGTGFMTGNLIAYALNLLYEKITDCEFFRPFKSGLLAGFQKT